MYVHWRITIPDAEDIGPLERPRFRLETLSWQRAKEVPQGDRTRSQHQVPDPEPKDVYLPERKLIQLANILDFYLQQMDDTEHLHSRSRFDCNARYCRTICQPHSILR
jgi:hypothetical protein